MYTSKFLLFQVFAIIVCIIDCVITNPVSTTFVVTLNSPSSACPSDAGKNCYILNDLTKNEGYQKNEYVFQSGTHILSKNLTIGYANNLTVQGQVNATIKCAAKFVGMSFSTAPNVMLKGLKFQDCGHVKIQNYGAVTVDISKCIFSNSYLILFSIKNLAEMRGSYIISSLILQTTNAFRISGYGLSEIDVTCIDAEVHIKLVPNAVTSLSDMHILNCNNTQFNSAAKNVTIVITKSKFINSCLKFRSMRTRSKDIHTQQIIIKHTTIQGCFCESIVQFNKVKIQFEVILNAVIITNNSSPFLKS